MRGFLAASYPDKNGTYSDLKVMRSAAGFYIGTEFKHERGEFEGMVEPGSRESEYFPTEAAAQRALKNETWSQRMNP